MKISFIGLGAIGLPIARRLALHPELELAIFDARTEILDREKGLGRVASSVADAIDDADAIFTVLPADAHVRSVAGEVAAAARRGQILLDFSTIAPSTMTDVAIALDSVGVRSLGGALTRSVAAAETGTLSIFVGGPKDVVSMLRPALDQMASDVRLVDTAEAAKALKITNNMVVSSLDLVICEALLLGARHGVDPDALASELARRGAASWPLENHIVKHLLTNDLGPGRFSIRYMGKDASLAAQLARESGNPAVFAGLVLSAYRGAEALGLGDHYHPIVMRWLEHAAAVGRTIGPDRCDTPAVGSVSTTVETICFGVVCLEALITFDALKLVATQGVSYADALEHFESGSASNDFVRALIRNDATSINLGEVVSALAAVAELAAQAVVPGIAFEVGQHAALSLVSVHGADLTVGALAARVP